MNDLEIWFHELIFSCCGQRVKEIYNIEEKLKELEEYNPFSEHVKYPSHMICPISSVLMTDPVKIPTNNPEVDVTCERAAIYQWVLDHQTSPFDRMPLTLENIRPNFALKKEIYLFIESQIINTKQNPRYFSSRTLF